MKVEVMVDKDNTHFSYMFECDKVIDGSIGAMRPQDDIGKLVILALSDAQTKGYEKRADAEKSWKTVAVFKTWTFWRVLDEDAKKCFRCGRYEKIIKNNLCQECLDRLPNSAR
jgi:hypothetical protein